VTPELQHLLLAWLDQHLPLLCVGFVGVCALASFRPKRDRF
jgi:hypothetical protein